MYVCVIDYKKAFQKVNHEKLFTCLQSIGVDGKDTLFTNYVATFY